MDGTPLVGGRFIDETNFLRVNRSNKVQEISSVCHICFCPTFFVGALSYFLGESFIQDALNDCLCYSGQTNREVGRIVFSKTNSRISLL